MGGLFANKMWGFVFVKAYFPGVLLESYGISFWHIFYLVRSCVRLLPPRDGVIVGSCNNKYLSVCRMECTEGYEAVGTVERRCVENKEYMTWTGTPMYCRGKG